ncbi:phospholipase [Streptomyces sp. NPDC059708]|uniref:phospholipase n=1 Tax=Streptomyces sp. NPDC059708 TaxID=3346916 RepID=UPI0036AEE142
MRALCGGPPFDGWPPPPPPAQGAPGRPIPPRAPVAAGSPPPPRAGPPPRAWPPPRAHRADWAAYGFDWSTDYCTSSPDNPFGFPFKEACARHDFGYRNYRAAGGFQANISRLDEAFHADLERVCARYAGGRKASCEGTAWTYYQAVRAFGASAEPVPAQPATP